MASGKPRNVSGQIHERNSKKGRVEVDQRLLIRKILARYPSEFTIFRELLQNADDAESKTVEIRFETGKKSDDVVKYTFKNTGKVFTEKDWDRLKLIASGNPDSGKVGAFGVGFYSIFSVTEEPVVLSGGYKMKFYWDGDTGLCWHQERLQTEINGATIEIPLRKPTSMPKVVDFLRFLATSITFMVRLKDVQVFLNEDCIGRIKKSDGKLDPIDPVPINLKPSGPLNMTVKSLHCHRFAIQFSSDLAEQQEKIKLDLSVFTIEVNIKMESELSSELLRCTFKEPDSQVKYSLIYTGKDEYVRGPGNRQYDDIFQGLRADLDKALHSKIFIGHSTRQTTGIGGHMASQFIPTVERESIDLVDSNVAIWNSELLYLGGFLSRAVYELELSKIQTEWERSKGAMKFEELHERFIHILKFFLVRPSTPSPKVAEQLREFFHTCSSSPIRLLSSKGVQEVPKIRRFDDLCAKFLKGVPLLSSDIDKSAADFVKAQSSGNQEIQRVNLSDVEKDLKDHILDDSNFEQLAACLRWMLRGWTAEMEKLLQVASFQGEDGTKIELSSIRYFIDPNGHGSYIPPDGPLPRQVIPRQIALVIAPSNLQKFCWKEFTIVDWLRYISQPEVRKAKTQYDFTRSIDWADRVLCSISSALSSRRDVLHWAKSVLASEKCIPTTRGLRIPAESYLPNSHLTTSNDHQLAIVQLPSSRDISWEMEQLLVHLGVRKHLPLRLLSTQKTSDIINYLVQKVDDFTSADIEELESSRIFSKEGGSRETRFCLRELYPPTQSFRQLQLPLIDLGGRQWQDTSDRVKQTLYSLGLRRFPPLEEIMGLCSRGADIGADAFDYLCKNLQTEYPDYNVDDYRDTAFIPTKNTDDPKKPGEVFRDEQWENMEFPIVLTKPEYPESVLEDIGIQRHPPSSVILRRLKETPPSNEETAYRWFGTLSAHVAIFQKDEIKELSRLNIVPKTTSGVVEMLAPAECYLKKSGTKHDLYSKLFHFVDFASGEIFLRTCGAKNEPTEEDVARRLADDPHGFYRHAGYERFLEELEDLASKLTRNSNLNETIGKMMHRPVLLGVRDKPMDTDEEADTPPLWKPSEIIIVDDEQTFQLFANSNIITAPRGMRQELEDFYIQLGSRMLTTAIYENVNRTGEKEDPTMCSKYRALVLDRLPLFLHNYSHLRVKPGTVASRFNGADDVVVVIWERITVSKSLISDEGAVPKEQTVSATAIYCLERRTIELCLTQDVEDDKHDLAVSLCRVLLGTENRPDVEFLTTCLSEEGVLKRRGYEIDPASRSQCRKAWKLTEEGILRKPLAGLSDPTNDSPAKPSEAETQIDSATVECPQSTVNQSHLLTGSVGTSGPSTSSSMASVTKGQQDSSVVFSVKPSGTTTAMYNQPPTQVMSQKQIETTVEAVMQGCKYGHEQPLVCRSDPSFNQFMKHGYCSESIQVKNIRPFCRMRNQDVYTIQGINTPDVTAFAVHMGEPLARFLDVIKTMIKVYGNLPSRMFRVFYDTAAGCIAFYDKGVIYLNLQYFEQWHYEDVKNGDEGRALSFWFLTIAHEIAHKLVPGHNSEHEFWFLAICDKYMSRIPACFSESALD